MSSAECRFVSDYLQRFGQNRSTLDLNRVSDHVKRCKTCYDAMSEFFRVLGPKKSDYLDATLDDLSFAVYNLVKALIREARKDGKKTHETVRCVDEPAPSVEYIKQGSETIDDVQDYTGEDLVRGGSMESLRLLIQVGDFNFARDLLQKGIDLGAKHSLDCANLKGIIHLYEKELDQAETCFRNVLATKNCDAYGRSVQLHAMSNLSYVYQLRDQLDEAIKWAERAEAVANEWAQDHFNCSFSLMYFYLLRNKDADGQLASEAIARLVATPDSRKELERLLSLETNKVIRDMIRDRGLSDVLPFALS